MRNTIEEIDKWVVDQKWPWIYLGEVYRARGDCFDANFLGKLPGLYETSENNIFEIDDDWTWFIWRNKLYCRTLEDLLLLKMTEL